MSAQVAETTYQGRMTNPPPEITVGNVEVRRIEVSSFVSKLAAIKSGRGTTPGIYTAMYRNGALWMSDTSAEYWDHMEAIRRFRYESTHRVLINGLGLGLILGEALTHDHIEHVDVVEIDPNVVAAVGPHFTTDPRVTIHEADAYTIKWPTGTQWDVAWHDIWLDLCTDNLPEMARLHRRYGRRVGWQGSWGKELLQSHRRREQAQRSAWGW